MQQKEAAPFFSVVVPVYNGKEYLWPCVESILGQTCQDFEILLSDDGSTDGSAQMCDALAEKYPQKIAAVHQQNEGQISARIHGYEHARGSYFMSLDADDMLRKDALELLKAALEEMQADVVIFNGSKRPDFGETYVKRQLPEGQLLTKESLYTLLCQGDSLNHIALKAFKREYAPKRADYKPYFWVRSGEDLLQSMELITRAQRIVNVNQNLYYYRVNLQSVTHAFRADAYKAMVVQTKARLYYAGLWQKELGKDLHLEEKTWQKHLKNSADGLDRILRDCKDKEKRQELAEKISGEENFRTAYQKADLEQLAPAQGRRLGLLYNRHWAKLEAEGKKCRAKARIKRKVKKIMMKLLGERRTQKLSGR